MKRPLPLLVCTLLASTSFAAKEKSTFRYNAPPDGERPVIVDATVGPQGSDFAMRLRFNREPWGEVCKSRCANATLLLDTDSSKQTGLHLTQDGPANGADVAIVVQGVREAATEDGAPPETWLRVKVRLLANDARSADDGELLAELNHRQDTERLHVDENTVYVLVDATSPAIPSARKVRVVYQPPGAKAVQASIPGMIGGGGGKGVRIFKDGSWGRARNADPRKAKSPASPAGDNG
ncbi:hypothetical protein JY651_25065 [Pyxidicoccus parkwayensis]|uniref:Lipoprotein n=1 Tax=Pyxidicoccus parkwayensis TaxID=2813578 RepID=A0ABX7NIH3_9BACT|nr:hypothetical protein [Pyxidicoccus parkwaysis]QSQ18641.1 hypothetical protein JY651_25065 [Pyxidicoccus parkwaysis]